jgi:hypothetical protein
MAKRTRHKAGLCLGDGHEHQHVCSSTLTPMEPFRNCRAGGSSSYNGLRLRPRLREKYQMAAATMMTSRMIHQ